MKVKDAKAKLQNLIDALNIYWDDAEFDIKAYDNRGGFYSTDVDNWLLDNNTSKVVLTIE